MADTCTTSPRNRLIGMETLTNLPTAVPRLKLSFAYDYMSRRVGKTVFTNASGSWILTSDSSFLYDGWSMIRESNVQGLTSNVSHYVYGLDLSGTLQGAGTIGGLLSRSEVSGLTSNVCFYAYDANGNVGQLIATNGATLAQYEYDPYGNIKQQSGSEASANPFRFSTKYLDAETGLYYYGYRYYSPTLGRWLSRDPIGEMGGENAYLAFYNDPVGQVDPDGLCPVFVTTDQGQEREVQSIRDIAIKRETGLGGLFHDRIQWVIANPPASIEEALADTSPLVVCDFKFNLQITVRSGSPIRSGQTYFYVPHVRGNDGRATGNGPFDAAKAHEMGHAYAYWIDVRPCAERIHARWGARALSEQEQRQVEQEYEACQTDRYWLDSGRYANEWERNYYDVTARGQFRRIFPSDPSRIGQVTQPVNYGGNSYNATDLWVAR